MSENASTSAGSGSNSEASLSSFALEVEVRVQERKYKPQVAGDRRLLREQRLDAALDVEVDRVDLVVERDHLIGELRVLLPERVHRAAQRA